MRNPQVVLFVAGEIAILTSSAEFLNVSPCATVASFNEPSQLCKDCVLRDILHKSSTWSCDVTMYGIGSGVLYFLFCSNKWEDT
jgi:hypothetical protein